MKIIKVTLLILLSIFGLYVIFCFFGPKKLIVSRSISIGGSTESVFAELADFEKWKEWSPWSKRDPEMKNTITGEPGTVGHKMAWSSKTMGDGEQELMEMIPNEKIRTSLKFKDWGGVSYADMILKPVGDSTTITWTMDGSELPFLGRGIMFFLGMEGALEKDYDEGLVGLKKVVESKPKEEKLDVEIMDMMDIFYVGKIFPAISEKMIDSTIYSQAFSDISKAVPANKIAGMPMSIAHNYNETQGTMDLEIAFPVSAEMAAPKGLSSGKIPGGRAVKYIHTGTYQSSGKAWGQLMKYVLKNHQTRYDGIEFYAKGPAEVQNPDEYVTWLVVPVE